MEREAEIIVKVKLNEKNIPVNIQWSATDAGMDEPKESKAFMLSVWDAETKNTMGIDLWTEEMFIEDMNIYFFQAMFKMAQTFENATNNKEAADKIRKCANELAEFLNSQEKAK